jgi:hypothetical protein
VALKDAYKAVQDCPERVRVKSLHLKGGGLPLFTDMPRARLLEISMSSRQRVAVRFHWGYSVGPSCTIACTELQGKKQSHTSGSLGSSPPSRAARISISFKALWRITPCSLPL